MQPTLEEGSWVNKPTTGDQRKIESYLLDKETKGKKILHIGIGNSSFAEKLCSTGNIVYGLTIYQSEFDHAISKEIDNYHLFMGNKYVYLPKVEVDIIVDNNPSTYSPNREAYDYYISEVSDKLDIGGHFVSHEQGLTYAVHDGFPTSSEELHGQLGKDRFSLETLDYVAVYTKIK